MELTPFSELPRFDPNAASSTESSDELGKDAFLKLLTVQLQNQDPTNPVENEAFVAQLAQFSSLEQLVGMQGTLDNVFLGISAMNNSSMSSLLGKDVVAVGDQFSMSGQDGATLHYEAAGPYDGATISIYDEAGRVVHSGNLPPGTEGDHTFEWDGRGIDGDFLPEGTYRFSIVPVGDTPPAVRTLMVGRITEMDYASGAPQPSIDGVPVSLDSVLRLTSGE
jgi:flagellar basal-body rod modification protein FlgD